MITSKQEKLLWQYISFHALENFIVGVFFHFLKDIGSKH